MNSISNVLGILFTICVFVCLLWDLRHDFHRLISGRSVTLLAVGLWYCLEMLRVPTELQKFGQAGYDQGVIAVAIATASFLIGYHFTHVRIFKGLERHLEILSNRRVLWSLMLIGIGIGCGAILIVSDFDFSMFFHGLWGTTRRWTGLTRSRYGSWRTIIFELQMFLQATIPLAVAIFFLKGATSWQKLVAFLFYAWMFLRTLSSGARSPLVPLLFCVAASLFWISRPSTRRLLIWVGAPIAIGLGYVLAAVIVEGRNEGRFDVEAGLEVEYTGFEMFRELLFIMRQIEQGALQPLLGMTYYTQLVNPIPRAIWQGKPSADAGLILARASGAVDATTGDVTMTVSPGFVGEAFLNFEWIGLLIVPFAAGAIVRAWDDLIPLAARQLPVFLVYCAGLGAIANSGRSFNFSTFYGLMALWILLVVFDRFKIGSGPTAVRGGPPLRSPDRLGTSPVAGSAS